MANETVDVKQQEAVAAAQTRTVMGGAALFAPSTGILRALRHRNYRLFWTGNFLSNIGTWMQNVAQGWLVLQLTNSAFLLGLVGFAQSIPSLIFSLLGGVIADRADRRKLLLATQTLMLLFTLVLAISISAGVVTVHEILAIAFLMGTATAINAPSYQSFVQDLVGKDDVLNAIALNSAQFNLSRVLGPSAAGLAVAGFGIAVCFYLNSLSFLAVIVALAMIQFPTVVREGAFSVRRNLIEGFRYVWGHGEILWLIILVALVSMFGLPYLVLMPIFARDVLNAGARGLGYLVTASGIGALGGALLLASWRSRQRRGPLVLAAALVFFTAIVLFALSRHFWLSFALLVVVGGAMVSTVATINSLLQMLVPDEMRGRVLSMHTMAFLGFSPLGSLLVGGLATWWSAPVALSVLAGTAIVLAGLIAACAPSIRQLH